MTSHRSTACILLASTLAASVASAEIYRVVPEGGGNPDGLSWSTAFSDLHTALGLAGPGDEVWVARGTYVPSTTDSTVSFVVPSGIGFYGGFAGTETARSQRDPSANVTTLSGDVEGNDAFDGTKWTLNYGSLGNSGHVLLASGTDASTVIDGFTVSQGGLGPAGTGASNPLLWGSGLYMVGGDATIRGCRFLSNRGAFGPGAGVSVQGGNPVFEGCSFEYNTNHIADGGGLYTGGEGAPVVRDCLFLSNTTTFDTVDNAGGGWYNAMTEQALIERCRFENNAVNPFFQYGGIGYGGGLMSFLGGCDVRDCVFVNNRASMGGGMITWAQSSIVNSLFVDNRAIEQPGGGAADAGGEGGGLVVNAFQPVTAEVVNCTFTRNRANKAGGASGLWNATLDVTNSIIWGNVATKPEVIGYSQAEIAGSYRLMYSDVFGVFGPPAQGEDLPDPENFDTCIDADPIFDPQDACLLAAGSPAIDSGDATALPSWADHDLAQHARFVDDPNAADTGVGSPPVDLGACEQQAGPSACNAADLAEPFGTLDLADIAAFVAGFTGGDPIADLDANGVFDLADIGVFVSGFADGCP